MPIFEYVCTNCGERFEKLVLSSKRARQLSCPSCGSTEVKKALSVFGVSGSTTTGGSADNCAPGG